MLIFLIIVLCIGFFLQYAAYDCEKVMNAAFMGTIGGGLVTLSISALIRNCA